MKPHFEIWVMAGGRRDYYLSSANTLPRARAVAKGAAEFSGRTMAVFDVRPGSAVFIAEPQRKKRKP